MTLAKLFPGGYLVAKAWHTWFNTNKPPFISNQELFKWGDNWRLLVQHEWPDVQQAYGKFESAVLAFLDDSKFRPVPSKNLWANADNDVLRQIIAERAKIAKALGVTESVAGSFVLTGWRTKDEVMPLLKKQEEANRAAVAQGRIELTAEQQAELADVREDPLWPAAVYAEWLLQAVREIKIAKLLGTGTPVQHCPTSGGALAAKSPTVAVQRPKAEEPPATPLRFFVKLPSRGEDLARWKETWDVLCQLRQRDKTTAEISKWLKQNCPRLHRSEDTLEKILRAGRLGQLDNIIIEAEPG